MAGRNDIDAKIGVDDSEFTAGIARAKSQAGELASSFSSIGTGAAVGLAAGFATAALEAVGQLARKFGEVSEAAATWGIEQINLARVLGSSTTEASVLSLAIGNVYSNSKQLEQATGLISQKLNTSEAAFTGLGVATRDTNGRLRDSMQIFLDVNERLSGMKEGTDRNVAATQIYGEQQRNLRDALNLTRATIEEARAKAVELGLVMGEESAAKVDKYRAAMNDAGDVMQGIKLAISRELLPAATELSTWFASVGPAAVERFRQAAVIFTGVVQALKTALQLMYETARVSIMNTIDLFIALGRIAKAALDFDWDSMQSSWNEMLTANTNRTKKYWEDIQRIYAEGGAQVDQTIARLDKQTPETPTAGGGGTGGATTKGKEGAAKSRMSEFEAVLAEEKASYSEREREEGRFREFSKESELSYWQSILKMGNLSAAEQLSIRRKVAAGKLAIDKEGFANEIAQQASQIDLIKNDYALRIQMAEQVADQIGLAYGKSDKRYTQALKAVTQLQKEQADELLRIDAERTQTAMQMRLDDIDAQRGELQLMLAQKLINVQEMIAIEADLAEQRRQIRMGEIAELEVLYAQEPVKLEQLNQRKLQIERDYVGSIRALKQQQAANDPTEAFVKGSESALIRMGNATLGQYKSLKDSLLAMFQSIYESFVENMIVKPLADTIMRSVRESSIYRSMFGQQLAGQTATSAGIASTKGAEAGAVVAANAAEAGSGAAASQASIPYIGPALALAAMATVFATVMSLRSARGGFDVPAGLNPMTQLHESEMVLPKEHADTIRRLAYGGGGGGGGTNVNISAMDGESVRRVLMNNQSTLADLARRAGREGYR